MSGARRLAGNTVANMSAHVVTAAIAFITLPFLLERFGQSYYGVFALVNSIVGFVALFDFGITIVLTKQIAQADPVSHSEKFSQIIKLGTRWLFAIGFGNALLVGAAGFIPGLFANLSVDETFLLRAMLLLYAAIQPIIWPAKVGHIMLAGRQRYNVIASFNVLTAIANAAAIVLVLFMGRGPLVLTTCLVAITTCSSLLLMFYALKTNHAEKQTEHGTFVFSRLSKELLRIALPIFVVQVAAFTVQQQLDRLVLGVMIGASAIAFYEVAAKLGSLAFQSTGLAISALPPFVAHKETMTTPEGMTAFFITGSRYLSLLLVPVYAVALICAPTFIQLWVGEGYSISILAAQLLIASALPYPFFVLIDSILVARDQFKIWVPYAIAVAIINLLFTIVLVSQFGFAGAAAGTFIACVCEVGCYLWVLRSKIHCSLSIWLRRVFVPTSVIAFINGLLASLLIHVLETPDLMQLVVSFVLVVLFGYGIIFLVIFSKDERTRCAGFLRSIASPWYRLKRR